MSAKGRGFICLQEQDRQAHEKQRKVAEAKERSEQRRGLSQPGSQPSVGAAAADNDPESRRHKAADAAERRRRGMSSSAELVSAYGCLEDAYHIIRVQTCDEFLKHSACKLHAM